MWGGVKHRQQYRDVFRQWSATKGLEELRQALYQEPRPWYMAYALHRHRHLLQDHHCARLLSWCTTITTLHTDHAKKLQSYQYAQEAFRMLAHSHHADREAFVEFLRLCAVGRDLSAAFQWHQHWREAGKEKEDAMLYWTWLLQIADLSPSDERAEDMALAIMEDYVERYLDGIPPTLPTDHEAPPGSSREHVAQRRALLAAMMRLRGRVDDPGLQSFLATLPDDLGSSTPTTLDGWPSASHHRTFPHMDRGLPRPACIPTSPRLQDSLLHPTFVGQLEQAAFEQRQPQKVIELLKRFQERLAIEKDRTNARQPGSTDEDDVWLQYSDATARRFRTPVVQGGGLTPEMYHYVISSLAHAKPAAALRTLDRMNDSNLRVLDATRAVVLVAAEGSWPDQKRLFQEQMDEFSHRAALDEELGYPKAIEHYWKYEYVPLFHHRNAMSKEDFLLFLLQGLGPAKVQQLLGELPAYRLVAAEGLVVMDEALRDAARRYFREMIGNAAIQAGLDAITTHMPMLDLALISAVPHFSDYALASSDSICTSLPELRERVQAYTHIYVLDASFVESSEQFVKVAAPPSPSSEAHKILILIPFVCLTQLCQSVQQSQTTISFDANLQQAIASEPLLASQRLRSLYALLHAHSSPNVEVRVLHFTECMLAHLVEQPQLEMLHLHPTTSDNHHVLLLTSMLRTVADPNSRIFLCTDDAQLADEMMAAAPHLPASSASISILSTPLPDVVENVSEGLINDNPCMPCGLDAATFTPVLEIPAGRQPRSTATTAHPASIAASPSMDANSEALGGTSPWLTLLDEAEDVPVQQADETPAAESVGAPAADGCASEATLRTAPSPDAAANLVAEDDEVDLMALYATPHDVVPIGVKMREASELGNLHQQFHVRDPEDVARLAEDRRARQSQLAPAGEDGKGTGGAPPRRRSLLEKEMLNNRGTSNRERRRMARSLSNQAGRRVPFNLRYRVVEADVRHPKNAKLRDLYRQGVQRKRQSFLKRME